MVDTGGLADVIPAIPALSDPPDGARKEAIPATLAWSPAPGATSYAVQVSKNNLFTDLCYSAAGLTATSHEISGLVCGSQYWWRVNATNKFGTSNWSGARSFSTFSLDLPVLSAPANDEADQPLAPTLSWAATEDAASYALQVSTDPAFAAAARFAFNDSGLTGTSRQVSGLSKTSTYYWRVRAKAGNVYSKWSTAWKFRTLVACATTSIAYGGGAYQTVSVKDQCWLKRNLDVGTMVASGTSAAQNSVTEKYCYDNDPANCATFGGLYSWDEAMRYDADAGARGICPDGWHIPTRADITALSVAISDTTLARNYLAAEDGGSDVAGFSARLAGYFDYGYFGELGDITKFWISETDNAGRAYYWVLGKTGYGLVWVRADKSAGYSVRCVQDN